ncbi:hypothetical protein DSCA_62570 [Desulfosarcina alkanivorans]|uniref:PAC domain-containing protein n=1 Tax=Desulfosarcina alkanivorans TaxID=571177 RepID=A0A5K7Z738_9BACT|nr:hypothetical protein DSCA_62570 [Desulfosarcina alkanivorans]
MHSNGDIYAAIIIIGDITKERSQEEQLRRAQKWRRRGFWQAAWPTTSTMYCPAS